MFFLRERMNKARITSVVLGLVGVFVMLKSGY